MTRGHEKSAYRFSNNPIFIGIHSSPKERQLKNVAIFFRLSVIMMLNFLGEGEE